MKLKNLINDDDAVSPVIGVILMVAITVILAAVIGTFVLGLGENLKDTAPTASITFNQQDMAGNDAEVKISHDGGAKLNADRIDIQAPGSFGGDPVADWAGDGEITAGETVTIDNNGNGYSSGAEIKVVWTSDGGGTSSVLGEHEVQ